LLGGSDEREKEKGKKQHGTACKIALGNDEEKQNLTALSSAQANDVHI
jgi:hypothetical protein